jgi:hypothetical protein
MDTVQKAVPPTCKGAKRSRGWCRNVEIAAPLARNGRLNISCSHTLKGIYRRDLPASWTVGDKYYSNPWALIGAC